MRPFTKIALKAVLIVVAAFAVLVVVVRSLFIVSPMRTDLMEPLIATTDIVVATKLFSASSLRSGDLVVADIPAPRGGRVLTVRKIEQQPDTPSDSFYLQAANSNGADSRLFGPLPASAIRAKVIWIYRRRPNQSLELTATRRAFSLFSVFRPLSSDCMLALGGGSSACSR